MRISYWANTSQSWADIAAGCHHVEATGWDGIWIADHFMSLPGTFEAGEPDPELAPMHECWTMLSALATIVPRVRLGTMVTGIAYRHPAVLANMAATLDHISGGRVVLGIGAGWQKNEHVRYGLDLGSKRDRSDRFEEACEVLSSLFTQERTSFSGRYYQLDEAPMSPKPLQDPLPLMIGGGGEQRTLRTAARFANEWNVWGTPAVMAEKSAVLDAHCVELGRDPAEITRAAVAMLIIADDEATSAQMREAMGHRSGLVGTVDQLRARVEEYEAAGVDELVVPDFTMNVDTLPGTMDRFRTEVMDR